MKQSVGDRIFLFLVYVFMILLVIITVYPIFYTAVASLSDPRELLRHSGPLLWPLGQPTLEGYARSLSAPHIAVGYTNTLFYVLAGTSISLVLTTMGAFIVSRSHFMLRNLLMKGMLLTMFFSGGLIPLFFVIRDVGIFNTRWAFILPYAVSTYNLIIMRSFFASIPASLEESAMIDGAADWRVLIHIYLPLSTPVLAVITIYYGVGYWNSWYPALVFLRDRTLYPMQMFLRELLILNDLGRLQDASVMGDSAYYSELVKYCTIIISTVPILLIYPFMQRYFVKGVMIGAIKG